MTIQQAQCRSPITPKSFVSAYREYMQILTGDDS